MYQLGSTHLQQKETIYVSQYSSLEYEGLSLELKKGILTCNKMKMGRILHYVAFSFSISLLHVLCMPCANPKMKSTGRNLEILCDEKTSFLVAAGLHLPFLTNNKYYGYGVEKPKRQKTYQRDSAFTGGGPKRTYQSDSALTGGGLKMTYQSDLAFFSAGGGFGGSGCCGGCGGCGGCWVCTQ